MKITPLPKLYSTSDFMPAFDNTNFDLWVPEMWAQEGLMRLEPNMAAAASVYQDYSEEFAQHGDILHVTAPGTFLMKRKGTNDDVVVQSGDATEVQVCLNQHVYSTFLIRDGEEALGWPKLREKYLYPAMQALAQGLDEIVLGQVYQFMGNVVGKIGTTVGRTAIVGSRTKMNTNLAPLGERRMFVTPNTEGDLLDTDIFSNAEKTGSTEALRNGSLGRLFGFDFHMCQNTPSISEIERGTVHSDTINFAAGYSAGATAIKITTGTTQAAAEGAWMTIAGDMIPQRITAYDETTDVATFEPGLASAVANGAAVTIYQVGAVNLAAGYAAGHVKEIAYDGFDTNPQTGRLVTFGKAAAAQKYAALSAGAGELMLDQPLAAQAANDTVVGVGPMGEFNFGFVPNAMALVMRPLPPVESGAGAKSYVASFKGLGVRVTIFYDGYKQGHVVTVDMLAGIKVLDTRLGVAMIG